MIKPFSNYSGNIDIVLDFHFMGQLSPRDIKEETEIFISKAIVDKLKRVRIIVGIGSHSKKGGIAKKTVLKVLEKLQSKNIITNYVSEEEKGIIDVEI
ncbi:Smr/MutS family protein [Candidatus Parcubacteria bacterium]|nr:Smr/MutS family protein [Candidatus Parcubacteria bacterium]